MRYHIPRTRFRVDIVEERMSRGILSANENDVKEIASVEAYILFASVNSQLLRHKATNEAAPVYFGRRHFLNYTYRKKK